MAQVGPAFEEYERERKRLNTRLGGLLLLLIPLPVILYKNQVSPLLILFLSILPPFVVGVVYPVWWRRRHHPDRRLKNERRFTTITLICRPLAFCLGMVTLMAWAVESSRARVLGFASALAAICLVALPAFLEKESKKPRGECTD